MASPHIATLPAEVILHITDHLLLSGQMALAVACKRLNEILMPIVWSEIELHHCGTQ